MITEEIEELLMENHGVQIGDIDILSKIFEKIPTAGNQINIIVLGDLIGLRKEIEVLKENLRGAIGIWRDRVSVGKAEPTVSATVSASRSEAAKKMWADRRALKASKEGKPEGEK